MKKLAKKYVKAKKPTIRQEARARMLTVDLKRFVRLLDAAYAALSPAIKHADGGDKRFLKSCQRTLATIYKTAISAAGAK